MNTKKLHLSGEVALLIVLLINSLGVDLMSKSEFGISISGANGSGKSTLLKLLMRFWDV